MTGRNYYEILGVPVEASEAEIRRAYRRKAMEFHPDRSSHPNAHERTLEINKAYEVLSNPNLRANYDRTLFPPGDYSYSGTSESYSEQEWYESDPAEYYDEEEIYYVYETPSLADRIRNIGPCGGCCGCLLAILLFFVLGSICSAFAIAAS